MMKFLAITSWLAGGLYFIYMCCNFRALRISIAILDTAADFFADTKRIIMVPFLYFTIGLVVFIFWIFGIISVASIGTI